MFNLIKIKKIKFKQTKINKKKKEKVLFKNQ